MAKTIPRQPITSLSNRLRAEQHTNTARELLTRVLSIWENTFGKDYPCCKNVREELDKLS